ncbi:MAG: 50S ribosomal protein L13 [Polyangiales bacterium]
MERTFTARPAEVTTQRQWYLVDATNKPLGRLASDIARVLRGKHKPTFTPHVDTGDFVVVVNSAQVALTGNKVNDKFYYKHSGYPGGLRKRSAAEVLQRKPEFIIEKAVKGMLPKGPLGRAMLSKLKVYGGAEHPHEAQQPKTLPAVF